MSRGARPGPVFKERWLHCFAVLTAFATWTLIWAGGLVVGTESGLAVPDWPLSYGMIMPPMVGGILYEHGHRLVAAGVGLLTVVLAAWVWRVDQRRWVRRLGVAALLLVITQGILGGLNVIYLLAIPVAVAHGTVAQTFLCLTVLLAFATSREWKESVPEGDPGRPSLRVVAAVATSAVYLQVILGAIVSHTSDGLAIPDFPLAFGRLIPPLESAPVTFHFVHRLWALVVATTVGWVALRVWREHRQDRRLLRPALAACCLLFVQISLGGTVVWTAKAVFPTTAHVATGALLLATSWLTTLRVFRHIAPSTAREPAALSLASSQGT